MAPRRTPTSRSSLRAYSVQDKFDQLAKELPQLIDAGVEVRVKDFGHRVERAKGSTDEPTVGDKVMEVVKCLACLPLINRLTKEKVRKKENRCRRETERWETAEK